jgi:DNA-binding IclR family transcriptional regulator
LTRNTITGLPAMYDELAQIRESSMAMDRKRTSWAFLHCRAGV